MLMQVEGKYSRRENPVVGMLPGNVGPNRLSEGPESTTEFPMGPGVPQVCRLASQNSSALRDTLERHCVGQILFFGSSQACPAPPNKSI